MPRAMSSVAPLAAMSLLTLVLSHNLVFVLAYGPAYGQALERTGHGSAWSTAVLVVLGLALGLLAAGTLRIVRLGRELEALPHPSASSIDRPGFARGYVGLWAYLLIGGSALFALQENLEHLQSGFDLPGLAVLTAGSPVRPIVVLAIVAAGVALVGQLYGWRRAVLSAQIAAARRALPRATAMFVPSLLRSDRPPASILGRGLAVRAPPLG